MFKPEHTDGYRGKLRSYPFAMALMVLLFLVGYSWSGAKVDAPATASNLNALVLLNSTNGWAVGNSGTILHFDGGAWNLVPSGTTADLFGISFGPPSAPNANGGFAVGGSGGTATALFWNGVGWSAATAGFSAPGAQKLASVSALNPSDAWAVDSISGAFWHWSGVAGLGGGWNMVSSAIAGLNSVFMISATEGWAVGVGGVIYRYAGGGWALFSTVGTTLNSVFMLNASEGWAVGNGGAVYHYASGSWAGPVSPGGASQDLRSIFMISQTEGWAVGTSGAILHFTGGVWTALPPNQLATNQNLNGVYFSGGTGWAVGDLGTIVLLGGQPVQGGPAANLQSVYLSTAADGWIVGCSSGGCGTGVGEPIVTHWNGFSFTRGTVSAATSDLYSVFMVGPSDGWTVGGVGTSPIILHYTGGSWTQVPVPVNGVILRSVFMVDSNNGWAVGDQGTILHYSGGLWGAVSSPTTNTLRSVFMLDSSDGWAVGDAGTMLRYQALSGQWVNMPSPTGARLNSVYISDSGHGWAVGAGGTILHYDGILWVNVADLVSTNLNSVFQVSPQDAWAVGDSATILRWTGISWLPTTPSPPIAGTPDLNSIFILSNGFGLIVGASPVAGSQGTILQLPAINPIPELQQTPIWLMVALITTIGITFTLRKRVPCRKI